MSNYIGYKKEDNARRKANNLGEDSGISKTMSRTKQWGGSGVDAASREAKKMRQLSKKQPVKIWTKEEIEALNKAS